MLLDLGCGLGGTIRYLAATVGCDVVKMDLTEAYYRVAEILSARVGLAERTVFRQGSSLALPIGDRHFDVIWTKYVQMNVVDKARFYGEIARVLKPGGQLAFHDVFAGASDGVEFPVPWAADASISHLIGVTDLQALMLDLGLARVGRTIPTRRWPSSIQCSNVWRPKG